MSKDLPILRRARYMDIARRILQGVTRASELAELEGVSTSHMGRILRDPDFRAVYDEAVEELYRSDGGIDSIIKSEKTDIALRRRAMQERAMTLLGESITAVRNHLERSVEGTPRAGILREGINAARLAIEAAKQDQPTGERSPQRHLHLHMTPEQADVWRDTLQEVEVDITHLVPGGAVDAEIIEEASDATAQEDPRNDRPDAVGGGGSPGRAVAKADPEDSAARPPQDAGGA